VGYDATGKLIIGSGNAGDAVLAATQTFTGVNTFSDDVIMDSNLDVGGDISIDNVVGDPFLSISTVAQSFVARIDQTFEAFQIRDSTNGINRISIAPLGDMDIVGNVNMDSDLEVGGGINMGAATASILNTGPATSMNIAAGSTTSTDANISLLATGTGRLRTDGTSILTWDATGADVIGTLGVSGTIIPNIVATTSTATLTIDASITNQYNVTALAVTMSLANPTNPTDGQSLKIRIKDNATAQTLTWSGSTWRAIGVTLPTTTTISKTMYIGAIYNATDTKWDVVAVSEQA
jgi:hypothetical protein